MWHFAERLEMSGSFPQENGRAEIKKSTRITPVESGISIKTIDKLWKL